MSAKPTYEALIRAHQGAVRTFLRRLTRNAALADDLAQDAFIIAGRKMGSLKNFEAARAWIFRIAYRVFLDHYRKTRRREGLEDRMLDVAPEPPTSGLKLDIEQAMDNLAPDCRAVVMLCLGQGMTHSEAANVTGLPIGTVKSHVSRGKAKLQVFLKAYAVQT